MRSLLNEKHRTALVRRLRRVEPKTPRRWGRMDAHQMVCHLGDAFHVALGDRPAARVRSRVPLPLVRLVALWLPVRYPRGYPAPREIRQGVGGTPPAEFARDMEGTLALVERFARERAGLSAREHPLFGRITERQWGVWAYRHVDHHLRQFGV
jgi:hypothetical protein